MKMHRTETMRIPVILRNEIVMVVFRQSSFNNQGVVDCTAVFRLCKRYAVDSHKLEYSVTVWRSWESWKLTSRHLSSYCLILQEARSSDTRVYIYLALILECY